VVSSILTTLSDANRTSMTNTYRVYTVYMVLFLFKAVIYVFCIVISMYSDCIFIVPTGALRLP
jgi:hypothetical protein